MNIVHKLAGIGAATALAAITVSVVAPQASAATYNGACGPGRIGATDYVADHQLGFWARMP
jgi:hypothetical protein